MILLSYVSIILSSQLLKYVKVVIASITLFIPHKQFWYLD